MRMNGLGDWVSDLQAAYANLTGTDSAPVATGAPIVDNTPMPTADSGSGTNLWSALTQALTTGLNYSLASQQIEAQKTLGMQQGVVRSTTVARPVAQQASVAPVIAIGGIGLLAYLMLKR